MSVKLALIQMMVTANKQLNLKRAAELVSQAAGKGAKLIVLPECFNSPYGTQYFAEYAEPVGSETSSVYSC
jgi:omega-amidase